MTLRRVSLRRRLPTLVWILFCSALVSGLPAQEFSPFQSYRQSAIEMRQATDPVSTVEVEHESAVQPVVGEPVETWATIEPWYSEPYLGGGPYYAEPLYGGNPWGFPSDWTWKFLPHGYLYPTYLASFAEPRLATQINYEAEGQTLVDSTIGGRIGFVRFGRQDVPEGFQLDLLAGAKLRQDVEDYLNMIATDFRFDIPLTYRYGRHAWKFGYYHVSSHTGDEFLAIHPGYHRINYFKDNVYLGYSYYATPEFRLYAEAAYAFNRDVAQPWELQFGFDYGPVAPTGIYGAPFLAANVHLRQELNFGGNINIQGGWAWRGDQLGDGILRTGPYYYDGGSSQFSFYHQHDQNVGWGLWYDY